MLVFAYRVDNFVLGFYDYEYQKPLSSSSTSVYTKSSLKCFCVNPAKAVGSLMQQQLGMFLRLLCGRFKYVPFMSCPLGKNCSCA